MMSKKEDDLRYSCLSGKMICVIVVWSFPSALDCLDMQFCVYYSFGISANSLLIRACLLSCSIYEIFLSNFGAIVNDFSGFESFR